MQSLTQWVAPWLAPAFTLWGSPVTWIEIIAFGLSIWMVLCNMRVDPLAWPLAIVSSLLYAMLFLGYKLYGEACLQGLFVAVALWGWWQWLRGTGADGHRLRVRAMSTQARLAAAALTLAAWPLLGWLIAHATDSTVPYFDALPTVGSVAGQILLGRKLVENWPVWIAVNLISIGLFAFKALWLTVLLYAIFAVMAGLGWRAWHALMAKAADTDHAAA